MELASIRACTMDVAAMFARAANSEEPEETPAVRKISTWLIGVWRDPTQNGDACAAQDVFYNYLS
jgi:hypothetical protein